jgi:hypothetical protein
MRKAVKNEFGKLRAILKNDPNGLVSLIILEDLLFRYETSKHHTRIQVPRKAYSLKEFENYPIGVYKLRKSGKQPLTFKDNLEARVKDKKLFDTYQDSSTSIIYSGSHKFKIEMISQDLLWIDRDFNDSAMIVDYSLIDGIELDRRADIYNRKLSKIEFLSHKGWDALFEGDKKLKRKFADKVYKMNPDRHHACEFSLKEDAEKGELRELVLCNSANDSSAVGKYDINTSQSSHFVQYVIKK